jgi:DNA polymerase-3 subunit chi
VQAHTRIVFLFAGRVDVALAAARGQCKMAKGAGHDATYWKETASGRFEKQG